MLARLAAYLSQTTHHSLAAPVLAGQVEGGQRLPHHADGTAVAARTKRAPLSKREGGWEKGAGRSPPPPSPVE
jgi:hypothetical protein